jgi:hypothetical protein
MEREPEGGRGKQRRIREAGREQKGDGRVTKQVGQRHQFSLLNSARDLSRNISEH